MTTGKARFRCRLTSLALATIVSAGLAACSESGETRPLALDQLEGDRRVHTFPALGGVQIEAAAGHSVLSEGDRVMVDPIGGFAGAVSGVAYLGLATQTGTGQPISSLDEFLQHLGGENVRATGDWVELFGYRLNGYRIDADDTAEFTSVRFGVPGRHIWSPSRDLTYLAQTPAGVLYVGFDDGGSPDRPVAWGAFSTLVRTAQLTGPGLERPLPQGSAPLGKGSKPRQVDADPAGPDPLLISFNNVTGGRYQLPNFGMPLSVNLNGWGVQPNQPGVVAFTWATTTIAGDSTVVFVAGLEPVLHPQAGGPVVVPDQGTDLTDIDRFLSSPPDNLTVENVGRVVVAGLKGVRFDAHVGADQSCAQAQPCEYAFATRWPWNFPVSLKMGNLNRIWWLPDHPEGPAMIMASDPEPWFLDHASALVDSIEELG